MSVYAALSRIDNATYSRLLAAYDPAELILVHVQGRDPVRALGVAKNWHGIHFVVTGNAEETPGLGEFVLGGRGIGDDLGHGPARILGAKEVAAIALALPAPDAFFSAFDAHMLEDAAIYPDGNWSDFPDARRDELTEDYARVRELYAAAAAAGDAMLLWRY